MPSPATVRRRLARAVRGRLTSPRSGRTGSNLAVTRPPSVGRTEVPEETPPPMPKIDIDAVADRTGCNYPHPFKEICLGATWKKLGDEVGLTDFGVNLVRLPPGKWSSQRHWHSAEDEFVLVLEGEVVAVEDDGDHVLKAGDAIGWKAGEANGH